MAIYERSQRESGRDTIRCIDPLIEAARAKGERQPFSLTDEFPRYVCSRPLSLDGKTVFLDMVTAETPELIASEIVVRRVDGSIDGSATTIIPVERTLIPVTLGTQLEFELHGEIITWCGRDLHQDPNPTWKQSLRNRAIFAAAKLAPLGRAAF